MEAVKILLATIAGTSAMTAFSYLASETFRELWKEPVLLNILTSRSSVALEPRRKSMFGWFLHYLFGLVFVACYHWIWSSSYADPTWFCGLIFGIISGMIGIAGWFFLFKLTEAKPKIKVGKYYLQLFLAHIVFALVVVSVYKLF